jgi:YfiH family protein
MSQSSSCSPWRATQLGGDTAIATVVDGAAFAFGLGPPSGDNDRSSRLSSVLASFDGDCTSISWCRQVHGPDVVTIEAPKPGVAEVSDGDALVTSAPRSGLLVWTADCVPVLLAGAGVVAAVHAGWRGCAADVVGGAVSTMRHHVGAGVSLRAAIGPAVCGDCYRVGQDVIDALGPFGGEGQWLRRDRVDLRAFVVARLASLGVAPEAIETVGGCTVESPALASVRRDGSQAGRQWALVFLTGRQATSRARPHASR